MFSSHPSAAGLGFFKIRMRLTVKTTSENTMPLDVCVRVWHALID